MMIDFIRKRSLPLYEVAAVRITVDSEFLIIVDMVCSSLTGDAPDILAKVRLWCSDGDITPMVFCASADPRTRISYQAEYDLFFLMVETALKIWRDIGGISDAECQTVINKGKLRSCAAIFPLRNNVL